MPKKKVSLKHYLHIFDKYPREFIVFGFFILSALIVIGQVFILTIIEHDKFKELALNQQMWEVSLPIKRWSIYSNNAKWKVLSTSVDLNDLAIDPQIKWDKSKLSKYLVELIYKEGCEIKTDKECYKNILTFLRVNEIKNFSYNEDDIKELIRKRVLKKVHKENVTSIILKENLSMEEQIEIEKMNLAWIFIIGGNLYWNPENVIDPSFVAYNLSTVLPWVEEENLAYNLKKKSVRYVPVINKLSLGTSDDLKKDIADENDALNKWIIENEEAFLQFIILTPHQTRFYPEKYLWWQIIGFVDNEWVGHYWVEWHFDNLLKWKKSKMLTKKDTMGRIIDPSNLDFEWVSLWWVDVTLTIDRNIQKHVQKLLEEWVNEFRANKWNITIMNPKTWEIIAMASYPSFDPNNFWNVYELEKVTYAKYPNPSIDLLWMVVLVEDSLRWTEYYYNWKKVLLRLSRREELWNHRLVKYKYKNGFWAWVYKNDTISSLYEPWSIMKPITIAVWLDTWDINRYDMYKDNWFVKIDQFKISNVDARCMWLHTFQHALNYSCNVWMIKIVQKIGKSLLFQYLKSFWFWQLSGITLEWEVFGKLESYEKWSRAQLFTTSYWKWIVATPLQMAVAYSTLVNDGVLIQPYIIKSIRFDDDKVVSNHTINKQRVISQDTSKIVVDMLVESARDWVAKNGWIEWYNIGGKTGTSQMAYKWKYETWQASTIGSYAWFWPAEDPKFVVIVNLERMRTNQYWWQTAALVFRRVVEYLLDYYGIPKREKPKEEADDKSEAEKPMFMSKDVVEW